MRKILLLAVVLIMMQGCNERARHSEMLQFTDSVAAMPPAAGYSACVSRIKSVPERAGILYNTAYYRAVAADSVAAYADLLDSLLRLQRIEPVKLYAATHRALCSYVLSRSDLDSLTDAAARLPHSADATEEEICSHMLAWLLTADNPSRAYELQLRAVQAMRHGGRWRPSEVLSQAAMLSCDMGRYPLGMDYLNEAYDSLETNGMPQRETVLYYGNKANLYSSIEMHDSALSANSKALGIARFNNYLMSDVLTFRAFIFSEKGDIDSAYFYLDSAEQVVNRLTVPYADVLKRYLRGRRGVLTIKTGQQLPAIRRAVTDLEACVPDNQALWEERFMLSYGRWILGEKDAITEMAALRDSIALTKEPALLLMADRRLIDAYRHDGKLEEASQLFAETFTLADTMDLRHARYQSIASELQHRVNAHERENQILKQNISQERERVFWLTLACVFGTALLIWSGIYLFLSQRLHKRRRAVDTNQITSLIENQKMLNRRLEEMQVSAHMDRDWNSLTPSSMSPEDMARFRQSFIALYPEFLPNLRRRCSTLTPGDENLCMLIRIGQSTDDIALALGISRASVNSARYRIRKKFVLAKEESLDDLINSL